MASLPAGETPLMHPRPWRYMPAHLQKWALHTVPLPGAARQLGGSERSVGSTLSAAARVALALEGRLHYERLAMNRPPPLPPPPDVARSVASVQREATRRQVDRHAPAAKARSQPEPRSEHPRSELVREEPARRSSASRLYELCLQAAPVEKLKVNAPSEDPCAICREHMLEGQEIRRLPCLHLFHRTCLEKWMRVKPTCPLDNIPV